MKPWGEWTQGRIQSIFEREFLAMAAFMVGVYHIIIEELLTLEVAGALVTVAGVIANFAHQRTKQKNGNQ